MPSYHQDPEIYPCLSVIAISSMPFGRNQLDASARMISIKLLPRDLHTLVRSLLVAVDRGEGAKSAVINSPGIDFMTAGSDQRPAFPEPSEKLRKRISKKRKPHNNCKIIRIPYMWISTTCNTSFKLTKSPFISRSPAGPSRLSRSP